MRSFRITISRTVAIQYACDHHSQEVECARHARFVVDVVEDGLEVCAIAVPTVVQYPARLCSLSPRTHTYRLRQAVEAAARRQFLERYAEQGGGVLVISLGDFCRSRIYVGTVFAGALWVSVRRQGGC